MSSSGHWLRLMDIQVKKIWACPNLYALTVAKNGGKRLTMSCEKCLVKTRMLLEDKTIICKGAWICQPFCERTENAEFTLCFFLVAIQIRRANSFDLCWCSRPLGLHLNVKRRFVPTQSEASSGSPSSFWGFPLHLNYDKLGGKRGSLLETRTYDYETFIFGKGASVITGCLLERKKRLRRFPVNRRGIGNIELFLAEGWVK